MYSVSGGTVALLVGYKIVKILIASYLLFYYLTFAYINSGWGDTDTAKSSPFQGANVSTLPTLFADVTGA